MDETILIFKKRGRKVSMAVTSKMRNGFTPKDCERIVNLQNYKDLALWLHDLEDLFDAPIQKAINQYTDDKKSGNWPF